jgi:2'-5' RNA ligase
MGRGAAARLFVAAELAPAVREELAAWGRGLLAGLHEVDPSAAPGHVGVRVLDPELMHLTLCFLGSRPVAEIDPIAAAIEDLEASACELALGAPLWLPRRRPRALAVEVADPRAALARLHTALVRALALASGWEPERRRFRPHITVARVRGSRTRPPLRTGASLALPPTPALHFAAHTVSLYRSRLAPSGATYELLASVSLAAA